MRQQYQFRKSANGLLAWDVFRLIKLSKELKVENISLSEISELDEAYWFDANKAVPTCRNIAEHAQLINEADLSYPIVLCSEGRVMDGMHRICKAEMQGRQSIKAVRFKVYIEPDFVGVNPDELPYDTTA